MLQGSLTHQNLPSDASVPPVDTSVNSVVTDAPPQSFYKVVLNRVVTQNENFEYTGQLLIFQTRNTAGRSFISDPPSNDDPNTITAKETLSKDLRYNDMIYTVDTSNNIRTNNDISLLADEDTREGIFKDTDFWKVNYRRDNGRRVPVYSPISLEERKNTMLNLRIPFTSSVLRGNGLYDVFGDMVNAFVSGKGIVGSIDVRLEGYNGNASYNSDKYNVFESEKLTSNAKNHTTSKSFVNDVVIALNNCLRAVGGDKIQELEYDRGLKDDYAKRKDHRMVAALIDTPKKGYLPAYNMIPEDLNNGLMLIIHSLQGAEVYILSYKYSYSDYSYEGIMLITYYDHFGLDIDDITCPSESRKRESERFVDKAKREAAKIVTQSGGFKQMFIMQHWQGLTTIVGENRPKPLITKIEFKVKFSGKISPQIVRYEIVNL